jgi:quercetin dioxygenase-like cupin family protein
MSLAQPTTMNGVTRTIVAAHPIPQLPGFENRFVLLQYPPGVSSPPHTHPVDGVNYIIQGTVESQWEGSSKIDVFKAGEVFLDYAEKKHVLVRNPSEEVELKILVSYVIEEGVPNVKMCE